MGGDLATPVVRDLGHREQLIRLQLRRVDPLVLAGDRLQLGRGLGEARGGPEGPRRVREVGPVRIVLRRHRANGGDRIGAGALGKVVLARQVDVTANRPFVTSDVLSRLLALYPTCMIFRIDGFLGASPELLIERRGAHDDRLDRGAVRILDLGRGRPQRSGPARRCPAPRLPLARA